MLVKCCGIWEKHLNLYVEFIRLIDCLRKNFRESYIVDRKFE